MTYKLDGYIDVPTRLRMALEKYPDLRVVEGEHQIIELGDRTFLVCAVAVYLTPDDTRPVTGSAWEPLPGLTPYSRNSEWMVGHTSALGRALGYLGFGIDRSIASANEIEARQVTEGTSQTRPDAPPRPSQSNRTPLGSAASQEPSKAQLGLLRSLGYKGPDPKSKQDASAIIDGLKKAALELEEARASEEDPF